MQTFLGRPLTCALNPRIGCEGEGQIPEAGQAKNVLVAGGGIGGMEAARTAALRGHRVCLMEKSERLGGVFVAAAMPAFKAADKELIAWYVNELDRLNVRVLLSMEDVYKRQALPRYGSSGAANENRFRKDQDCCGSVLQGMVAGGGR